VRAIRIIRVPRPLETYGPRIAALEAQASYPLGSDRFTIDHGADYFAFFRRLGDLHYYAAIDGDEVVAVGAGILRRLRTVPGGRERRAWYLCDLKVRPDHHGRGLPLRMLGRAFFLNYLRCPRGYGISMDPGGGRPNRLPDLLARFRWLRLGVAARLVFYAFDAATMRGSRGLVEAHRGPVSFLSLDEEKRLILESTGRPLPLLHLQHGPMAESGAAEPRDGHIHMLCAPEDDPLVGDLSLLGKEPIATASVIQHGMGDWPWKLVLTSDI
jgi:hypothetical protein